MFWEIVCVDACCMRMFVICYMLCYILNILIAESIAYKHKRRLIVHFETVQVLLVVFAVVGGSFYQVVETTIYGSFCGSLW